MAVALTTRVFTHSRSTLAARLVLLVVADQAPTEGEPATRLSVAELAHRAGLSTRQAIAAVRRLEALGELRVERGRGKGPAAFNRQVITLDERPGGPPDIPSDPYAPDRARRWTIRRTGLQRAVWDRDGWECKAAYDEGCTGHKYLTTGHIIPVTEGGTDDMDNLQTECLHCNTAKGAR